MSDLLSQKAYFYVCGDAANMAREVNTVLAQIIAEGRGVSEAKGEEIVKNMRAANQYQVRPVPISHFLLSSLAKMLTRHLRKTYGHKEAVSTSISIWDGRRGKCMSGFTTDLWSVLLTG